MRPAWVWPEVPTHLELTWGVEAVPSDGGALGGPPWGRQSPRAWAAYLVVHLFGAVEDVDHGAQGSAQVLGRLRLASPGGASGGSAHDQVKGLGQGYVASAKDLRSPRGGNPTAAHFLSLWFSDTPRAPRRHRREPIGSTCDVTKEQTPSCRGGCHMGAVPSRALEEEGTA